jgi:hypothetical protein
LQLGLRDLAGSSLEGGEGRQGPAGGQAEAGRVEVDFLVFWNNY